MRRKTFIFFILPIVLFGAIFFLRHQLLVVGTKVCLNKTFPHVLTYQNITASNGKVCIQGLKVQDQQMVLILEKTELDLNLKEAVAHSKSLIKLWRKGFSSWNDALNALKFYGTGLNIRNGILQLKDQRYDFHFTSGSKTPEIGTLSIDELLDIQFLDLDQKLIAQLIVEKGSSERLIKLMAFAVPEYLSGLEGAKGEIELRANAVFKKNGQLSKCSARFGCDNFEARYPKLKLAAQAKKLTGALNYPEANEDLPIWKQMECKVLLEKGSLLWDDKLALLNLNGDLELDPKVDPLLALKGELAGEGKPLKLHLEGKGAIHEDRSYWLEFALKLNNVQGTECGAFLSVCRPEPNDLVVQLEASNLLAQQVEMLKEYFAKSLPRLNDWEVRQGNVGGKLVALFEKGDLARFEIQDLVGKDITLVSSSTKDSLIFSSIKGEGRLFDALNFEIILPADHLFSFSDPELKEVFSTYRPDETARLSMTVKFGAKEVETLAHVDFIELKQALQFGYKSKTAFPASWQEITEGWGHCERITHMLYGPFIKFIDEDLNLYGAMDVMASYDGKRIDCSLQVDEFLAKHPLLDLKAPSIGEKGKTQGRVKFTYDLASKTLNGSLPIVCGEAYDRTYGLHFKDLSADLTFSSTGLKGHVANTDIFHDEHNLLKKAHFDFSYGKELSLKGLFAQIALPGSKEYFVSANKLDQACLDFRLLQGKEELAHFTGSKEAAWTGILTVKPIKEKFDIQFAYDARKDVAILDANGAGIQLLCKKQGPEYSIDKLEAKDFSLNGAFSKAEEGFNVSRFELQRLDTTVCGSGVFFLDLPQADLAFGARGDLAVAIEMSTPVPLKVKTTRLFKAAYSPELGFVMSDINLAGLGCQFNIGQLQYQNVFDKVSANNCAFKFSEEFLSKVFEVGVLPSLLRDFKICKTLSGELNYSADKKKIALEGFLGNEKGPVGIALEWKGQGGEFSLSREELNEKLTFQLHKEINGLHLDGIKGTLQGLTADLKQGKDLFKGQLTIDFAAVKELIDLPLSKYLDLWKAGGKFQFEGVFTPSKQLNNWAFRGKMRGRDFECGGYQLHAIEAKIELEPGRIALENLDLTDDAGKLWLGEGVLMRSNQNKQWFFSFPSIEIRGFQPSLLTKIGNGKSSASSLIVKSAVLQNVRGKIDELKSLTGSGKLCFTNISKKGEKVLPKRLPFQLLERIGLEAALLIPTSGEMEYTIENGRCYLREVQSVISEKRRSEFLAPRNESMGYLDFDGNFFVNLQVKQNVVRSITSPLNLQVRGKWEDPQLIIVK